MCHHENFFALQIFFVLPHTHYSGTGPDPCFTAQLSLQSDLTDEATRKTELI